MEPQLKESDDFWHRYIDGNSGGNFVPAQIQLAVQGLEAQESMTWFSQVALGSTSRMVNAESEHFVVV